MKKTIARLKTEKDLTPGLVLAAGLLLVAVKLVLCSAQRVFLWPEEALLDDMALYNSAVSITEGDWLGAYGPLTLAKHSFFSLWLAGLHTLGIPYLLGGNLLWVGACLAAAWALLPVLKKRWVAALLFAVLLFNPASTANPAPYGFVLRVYRDNIFPALCLLCVAGMAGFALRHGQRLRRSLGWLVLAGLAFAACWLCREDGWWLLPFVLGAAAVTAIFVLREKDLALKQKLVRLAALVLPFVLLLGGVLAWCGANNAAYGRFVVSDFSSGEFADAYGAMTRIEHENWDPKVDVPGDVREKLYAHVPDFAQLQPLLESDWYKGRYAPKGDYNSGSFYWALREAAAELGYYDSPEKARAYFAGLASEINALCDAGILQAGPARSSVSPPIKAAYVGPVLKEGLYSLWFCATFMQCDARSMFSPHSNDPVFYEETIKPMEDFLHERAHTVTQQGSEAPWFTFWQRLCFGALDIIRTVYSLLLPVAFVVALCWLVAGGAQFLGRLRRRQRQSEKSLVWVLMLGLLLCILLRVFMVAFVTVSSFEIGTFVMYLASVHPLMLVFAFVGCCGAAGWWRERRGAQKARVAA